MMRDFGGGHASSPAADDVAAADSSRFAASASGPITIQFATLVPPRMPPAQRARHPMADGSGTPSAARPCLRCRFRSGPASAPTTTVRLARGLLTRSMRPRSRLVLRSDLRRTLVRELVRPPRIPGALPAGPQAQPPDYGMCSGTTLCTDIHTAVCEWYGHGRIELAPLAGVSSRSFAPRFRWTPTVGRCASPYAGSTAMSTDWRILGSRLADVHKWHGDLCARTQSTAVATTTTRHLRAIACYSAR